MPSRLATDDETVTIQFKVPKSLKSMAKATARAEGRSFSAAMREVISCYVLAASRKGKR